MSKILKPNRLKVGDTVAVIGMSAACKPDYLERGCQKVSEIGFNPKIVLDPAVSAAVSGALFSSELRENRAQAFQDCFQDDEIAGIILARGGAGAQETLPLIDFSSIVTAPKLVVGFSDVTNLHIPLYQQAGLVTLHGPMVASNYAKAGSDPDIARSIELFAELNKQDSSNVFGDTELIPICSEGDAAGPLTGGNLTILAGLVGTPWQPKFDDHILLIEDVNEVPHRIDRPLRQMKLAGMFDNIKAVVAGYFTEDSKLPPPDRFERVLADIFGEFDIPVYYGAPFGHADPNYTWAYGIRAKLEDNRLSYQESIFND